MRGGMKKGESTLVMFPPSRAPKPLSPGLRPEWQPPTFLPLMPYTGPDPNLDLNLDPASPVRTSSAPKALSSTRLSRDIDAGMVRMSL